MYYYRGEKIGTYEQAFDRIMGDPGMRLNLIAAYLSTYTDRGLADMITGHLDGTYTLSFESLIDDALDDMAGAWHEMYFKEPGEFLERGDFAFENWEGEE